MHVGHIFFYSEKQFKLQLGKQAESEFPWAFHKGNSETWPLKYSQ